MSGTIYSTSIYIVVMLGRRTPVMVNIFQQLASSEDLMVYDESLPTIHGPGLMCVPVL